MESTKNPSQDRSLGTPFQEILFPIDSTPKQVYLNMPKSHSFFAFSGVIVEQLCGVALPVCISMGENDSYSGDLQKRLLQNQGQWRKQGETAQRGAYP